MSLTQNKRKEMDVLQLREKAVLMAIQRNQDNIAKRNGEFRRYQILCLIGGVLGCAFAYFFSQVGVFGGLFAVACGVGVIIWAVRIHQNNVCCEKNDIALKEWLRITKVELSCLEQGETPNPAKLVFRLPFVQAREAICKNCSHYTRYERRAEYDDEDDTLYVWYECDIFKRTVKAKNTCDLFMDGQLLAWFESVKAQTNACIPIIISGFH